MNNRLLIMATTAGIACLMLGGCVSESGSYTSYDRGYDRSYSSGNSYRGRRDRDRYYGRDRDYGRPDRDQSRPPRPSASDNRPIPPKEGDPQIERGGSTGNGSSQGAGSGVVIPRKEGS